jgi:hypothetical protein
LILISMVCMIFTACTMRRTCLYLIHCPLPRFSKNIRHRFIKIWQSRFTACMVFRAYLYRLYRRHRHSLPSRR